MARKDNDPEKKPSIRRVYILLAILLGLLLPFVLVVPSMVEEHARRNQLLKNVPKEGLIQGLSKSLFGDSSWEKTDLNRIVGVELREDETTMCGFACMKYWNNRNVPTEFDDLTFYVFKNKRDAKAALRKIKKNLGEITDKGDNFVRGWERDVIDASIENYYYVDKNLMIIATVTSVNEMPRDENDPTSPVMGGGQEALDLIRLINDNFR